MFSITHQERKVLIFIGILILVGSILRILNLNAIEGDPALGIDKVVISGNIDLSKPVNINLSFSGDLESIPGIGEVIARRIIDYRNQFGYFKDLEDLKNVKGIGDKKIETIRKYITFQ